MKGQGRDGFCPFFEDFCFILIDFFLGNGLRKKADLSVSFFLLVRSLPFEKSEVLTH